MKNKKERQYQGIQLSKKQSEWVRWYQRGENSWWNAFYEYEGRKMKPRQDIISMSWFNHVLKSLKQKGLFNRVPFAFFSTGGLYWVHPGFENSGDTRAEVGVQNDPKLLTIQKPVI